VSDLQRIQSQIVTFWQSKDKLPDELSDLNDDILGFRVPRDPVTDLPYDYSVLGGQSFSLCAEFARNGGEPKGFYFEEPFIRVVTNENAPAGLRDTAWWHTDGLYCFERTIDPDFFPDRRKPIPFSGREI